MYLSRHGQPDFPHLAAELQISNTVMIKRSILTLITTAEDDIKLLAGKELQDAWDELKEKVAVEFEKNSFNRKDVDFRLFFRMQYQGQLNDLEIEAPIGKFASVSDWESLVEAFEDTYTRVYAKAAKSPELGYSITGAIIRGVVEVAKPKIPKEPVCQ